MRAIMILAGCLMACLGAGTGPLYLIDSSHVPHVVLSWTTSDGEKIELEADRPYGTKYDRTFLGHNVDCFVAIGGTRIDKGCGHPKGIVVRVGLYKRDKGELFFEGLPADGSLHMELHNVLANQPGGPTEHTVIQHIQYTQEDIESCGLGRTAFDQFNTLDKRETLLGQLTEANTRPGALDGDAEKSHGSVRFERADDGTLTMIADIPYMLLRHTKDPWVRAEPGLFLEPYHFHIEFEMLPDGVEPLPLAREKPDSDT
jgi:hypothetical protein